MEMSKQEKRIEQLLKDPTKLRYSDVESLLIALGFEIKELNGSHKLIYRPENPRLSTTIALHNNDCKSIYKINMKKLYLSVAN
jgi:hypothetical protein